jgi:hypothetical protein
MKNFFYYQKKKLRGKILNIYKKIKLKYKKKEIYKIKIKIEN